MVTTIELPKVKIDFDKPHPDYFDKNGQLVPGVTTALKELSNRALMGWAWKEGKAGRSLNSKRDKAGNIGTIAHEILKGRELGYEIDPSNIAPDNWEAALEVIKSHDNWYGNLKDFKTLMVETQFVSEIYRFGGTFDKYGIIQAKYVLIDYKSGKDLYEENLLQGSGYAKLIIENGYPLDEVWPVNLPKTTDGNFKHQSVSVECLFNNGYFEKFMAGVAAWYASQKIKQSKEVK